MKKARFTFVELALIAVILAMFAVGFSGCVMRERARSKQCINNLKQLGTTVICYVNDHRNDWPNSPANSYAWNLARGKYAPNDMKAASWLSCPSVKCDPDQQGQITTFDQSNIQMYAAIADNRAGRDDFSVIRLNQPELSNGADRIGGKAAMSVGPSQRLWICDGLRPDTQRQRTLLSIAPNGYNMDCARPYAIHKGRVNILTQDGTVVPVKENGLPDYYVPYFPGEEGVSPYSVRLGVYISKANPKEVLNLAD